MLTTGLDVIPWSPQLLRQFEFVGSGLPRKHTAAILDLLLRVFREREDTQAVLKAEMPIYRKRKLCGRLLGLVRLIQRYRQWLKFHAAHRLSNSRSPQSVGPANGPC